MKYGFCKIKERWRFMKKVFKFLGPIVIMVALLLTANHFLKPKVVVAAKEVTLTFKIDLANDKQEIGELKVSSTDENELLTLGDVIDKVNNSDVNYKFILNGDKNLGYGRYLEAINDMIPDLSKKQFWSIHSKTNPDCNKDDGCNGLDIQPVLDQDVFDFILTNWE